MAIVHLADSSFDGFVKGGVSVVDFWASWCGPCRAFGPIFEAASDRHPGVAFGKYEITDTNRAVPAKYGVRSIPTILAFRNGEPAGMKVGLTDEGAFDDWIKELES